VWVSLTGINTIIFYSTTIFASAGVNDSLLGTVLVRHPLTHHLRASLYDFNQRFLGEAAHGHTFLSSND
jgi:hypothetical protein